MRRPVILCLAAALGLGCTGQPPSLSAATPRPARPGEAAPKSLPAAAAVDAFRPVGPDARQASLVGRVRLLASGAGLISDHGAGIVTDNGAGVISNNGGGLVGKTRYALAQAPAEVALADAVVEVLDAAGRVLTDAEGQPVAATTGPDGRYRLEAALPPEALVLRVKLFPKGGPPAAGGQLLALVARERVAEALAGGPLAAGPAPVDLDTASAIGAAYVLDRLVAGQPDPRAVLDRLPAAEAEGLHGAINAALPADQAFDRAALVAGAEALQARETPVAASLERIRAILLAGQAELGEGLPATQVALSGPIAAAPDGRGGFYVAEVLGRVRHVGADGRIRLYAGVAGTGALAARPTLARLESLVAEPDGSLLVTDALGQRVLRLPPDGPAAILLGTGKREQGQPQTGPTTSVMGPAALARAADGTLYVGEVPRSTQLTGRLLRLAPGGAVTAVDLGPGGGSVALAGVALGSDGALWALNAGRWLRRRGPDGSWATLAGADQTNEDSRLLALPDGSVLVSEPRAHVVARYAADGTRTVVAGTGQPGWAPDGTPATSAPLDAPAGLALLPGGDVLVTEPGAGLVRRLRGFAAGQPTAETVAGTRAAAQVGDARAIALNVPGGLAFDDQGRLLVAETGGDTIKRLAGGQLAVVAGSGKGFAGDGGPAAAARFDGPSGLAWHAGGLYVVDAGNERIRRVDFSADPPAVTSVAGHGRPGGTRGARVPALEVAIPRPYAVVVGPDGRPYWSDTAQQTISRLTNDGQVEVVAGTLDEKGFAGDGGPAAAARFTYPAGLAFDAAGDLYVADAGNACVRRIRGLAGPGAPTIERVAGAAVGAEGGGLAGLIGQDGVPDPAKDEGRPAAEVVLYLPLALAFDAEGRLLIAEAGTAQLQAITGLLAGPQADQLTALLGLLPPVAARIRRVGADGRLTTLAGPGGRVLAAASGDDALAVPVALAVDRDGGLVVSDGGANQLKRVPAAALAAP